MSRDIKKSRIYYDTKGVKAYDRMMTERYKNRKNPDNILPEGITDAEFRKAIIDIFCGVAWFISYPGSQTQVNEEAIETIIESITNKSATERLKKEEMKKNLALPEGVAEIPIEALDLSTRPYNCLKRARINTVGQLQEMTEEKLLRLRNLGLRSMEEIQSKLKEYKAKKELKGILEVEDESERD